jgi:beta-glucanase (GH16 family)
VPGSNVVFSDDFAGTSLSSAWTVISRHGEYSQDETECNTPQQVSVADNVLTISTIAQQTVCGDYNVDGSVRHAPSTWPYATGDVQWSNFNFTYGTVTVRAKFPPQDTSTWPAIWLLGSNCQNTNPYTADVGYDTCPALSDPSYREIDMTECFGGQWCQLALAQPTVFDSCDYVPQTDDNWHTFQLVWTPTSISTSVDGKSTGCSFTSSEGYIIPSQPMFLIMQTQTGGIGGTPQNLPTTLQISSVTVTQP